MDEADEPAPGKPVLHGREWARRSRGQPHFAQERLEPNPMLVGGPQLDLGLGEGGRDLP